MARKIDLKKREEIAMATFALLQKNGFQKTSMSEIAKALNMKRPTLYWYFKDVGAICETLFAKLMFDVAIHIEEHTKDVEHPIDLLYAHMTAVHEYFAGKEELLPCMFQLWATVGARIDPNDAIALSRSYFLPRRQRYIAALEAGIAHGTVAPCDPTTLVHLVSAVVDGMLLQRITHATTELPPVNLLIWTRLLEPLKAAPSPTRTPPHDP